jgi:hypothetical protein
MTESEQLNEQWKKGKLPAGYYTIECNNCIFISLWNGVYFKEEDKMLADFLKKYPVEIIKCFKELR